MRDQLHVFHHAADALIADARFVDALGKLVGDMTDLEEELERAADTHPTKEGA